MMDQNSRNTPYPDDLSYVLDELRCIHVRARRVSLPQGGPDEGTEIRQLRAEEVGLRRHIDSRLNINRKTGPALGLDEISRQHNLLEIERTVLLLSLLPVLGSEDAEDRLRDVSPRFTPAIVSPETVFEILELDDRKRLLALPLFTPSSRLVTSGLVNLGYEPDTPAAATGVGLEISWQGLAAVTGIEELAGVGEKPNPSEPARR